MDESSVMLALLSEEVACDAEVSILVEAGGVTLTADEAQLLSESGGVASILVTFGTEGCLSLVK
jgi:hypothetical protein